MLRLIGTVSTKKAKQIGVLVERHLLHSKLPRMICNRKEFIVTDQLEQALIGDTVAVEGPEDNLQLIKILQKARMYKDPSTGEIYTCK